MPIYEAEYACFVKIRFEAADQEEADMIAGCMDDEEIEKAIDEWVIWNDPEEVKENTNV